MNSKAIWYVSDINDILVRWWKKLYIINCSPVVKDIFDKVWLSEIISINKDRN